MVDIRQNEISQAQNNPNILTPLVGASSPQPMQAPPKTNEQAMGMLPPDMQQVYSQAQAQTKPIAEAGRAATAPLAGNIDQMTQALFAYDQQLEAGKSPFPQYPWYVENPADMYSGGARYAGATGQTISQTAGAQQNIQKAYENAINTTLQKFLDFYQIGEDRRREDEEKDTRSKQDQWESQLALVELGLVDRLYNPYTKQTYDVTPEIKAKIMGDKEKRSTSVVEIGNKKILVDTQTGEIIKDLGGATSLQENLEAIRAARKQTTQPVQPVTGSPWSESRSFSGTTTKPTPKPSLDSFWR